MRSTPKILILFSISVLFNAGNAYSQNLQSLSSLIPNKSKEIEKALDDIAEAGKITQEANNYYNEAQQLQSNYDLDEKTLQKELSKTEEKALELQLRADKLYSSAHKLLNKLCTDEINNQGVSYGESESYVTAASDLMNQATAKREDANQTKNPYEKATLLSDAAGLESAAIDNLIAAMQVMKGITPEVSPQTEAEEVANFAEPEQEKIIVQTSNFNTIAQKSENLAIDESQIQQYNNYVNDPAIPDPITISRNGVSGVSEVSMDTAKKVLLAMQTGNTPVYPQPVVSLENAQQAAIADSMTQFAQTENLTEEKHQTTSSKNNLLIEKQSAKTGKTKYPDTEKSTREFVDLSYSQQSSGVRFHVQIAASRSPLSRSQLWAICPGNLSVEIMNEDGWYKYRIMNFRIFSEANRVAIESGVKSAWVMAVQDGHPVRLVDAREMTRLLEADVKRHGNKAIKDGIDFYVQVAASRIRLTETDKNQLFGNTTSSREIIESGWFKYQIYAGTSYTSAIEIMNVYSGKAFITAYQNGTRIKLRKAIKQ
jgi:hypothetical protein